MRPIYTFFIETEEHYLFITYKKIYYLIYFFEIIINTVPVFFINIFLGIKTLKPRSRHISDSIFFILDGIKNCFVTTRKGNNKKCNHLYSPLL